jgi:hypothetical protein
MLRLDTCLATASLLSDCRGESGAGVVAAVGKMFCSAFATKGSFGTTSHPAPSAGVFGEIVAVNAVGGIYHPDTRQILAGARGEEGRAFVTPWQRSSTATWLSPPPAAVRLWRDRRNCDDPGCSPCGDPGREPDRPPTPCTSGQWERLTTHTRVAS